MRGDKTAKWKTFTVSFTFNWIKQIRTANRRGKRFLLSGTARQH